MSGSSKILLWLTVGIFVSYLASAVLSALTGISLGTTRAIMLPLGLTCPYCAFHSWNVQSILRGSLIYCGLVFLLFASNRLL